MPFPADVLVLTALAEQDLFAALSLIDVNSSLRHIILDDVVSVKLIIRFLRNNKKALVHGWVKVTGHDVIHLAHACTALQSRMDHETIYTAMKEYLAILLDRCPAGFLFNPDFLDYETLVEQQVSADVWDHQKEMHKVYLWPERWSYSNQIRFLYTVDIKEVKWIYSETFNYLYSQADILDGYDLVHRVFTRWTVPEVSSLFLSTPTTHPLLQEQVLFCGRYLTEILSVKLEVRDFPQAVPWYETNLDKAVETFLEMEAFLLQPKFDYLAGLKLDKKRQLWQVMKERETVRGLWQYVPFGTDRWNACLSRQAMVLEKVVQQADWSPFERAWWFSMLFAGQAYVPTSYDEIILNSFETKVDAIAWLFLASCHSTTPNDLGGCHYCFSVYTSYCPSPVSTDLKSWGSRLSADERMQTLRKIKANAAAFAECCYFPGAFRALEVAWMEE